MFFDEQDQLKYCKQSWEKALIGTLRPLIEDCPPSAEMCSFLSHHCKDQSSLPIIKDSLVYTITRILKHNFVSIPQCANGPAAVHPALMIDFVVVKTGLCENADRPHPGPRLHQGSLHPGSKRRVD